MCITRWRSSVRRVTSLPGADCGTDRNLLITDVKIKLKRIKTTKLPPKYDVENSRVEHTLEVKNMFSGLQLLENREPDELSHPRNSKIHGRQKVVKSQGEESLQIAIR